MNIVQIYTLQQFRRTTFTDYLVYKGAYTDED